MLAVVRTLTSAIRVLEALDLLRCDTRIQVVFAVDDTSAFGAGTARLLEEVGARTVPWDRLADIDADLVVTASENVDLDAVRAPVVVLPHGVGFHKHVPDSSGTGVRLSGLVPRCYLAGRDVTLVASHRDQVSQLAAVSPEAAARTAVVGDLCFDRLVASRRLRPAYRRHLGVDGDRRLVVMSSTWREQSLLGRWPDLPARLLAELPADEYQVAMILHPNVWSRHGPWQVRCWLADARDAGLLLIPPYAGWQAGVVAADVVVGDHGSVTFYAAALGVPVLLAAFGDEVVPGTPLVDLARLAPRLRADRALGPQLERAVDRPDPALPSRLAGAAFDRPGEAVRLLRELLYQRMALPEPESAPATRAWPVPCPEATSVRSYAVVTTIVDADTDATIDATIDADVVAIRRYPALLARLPEESAGLFTHLAVYDDEPDPALAESASVIVRAVPDDPPRARAWAVDALRRYPGCRLAGAATPAGCQLAVRGGSMWTIGAPPGDRRDPMLLAAAGYARLRAGTLRDGPVWLALGERQPRVKLTITEG